jgi:division protein CdvB (Snf7/Vps24/ESCRT-III family)
MKLEDKLTVHLVTSNVTPVHLTPPVKNVLETLTELLNQIVDVLMVTLKSNKKSVQNVTVDVTLVLNMLKTV